jgi:hypothetical protein
MFQLKFENNKMSSHIILKFNSSYREHTVYMLYFKIQVVYNKTKQFI